MQSVLKELNCHGYEKGETFKLVLLSFLGDNHLLHGTLVGTKSLIAKRVALMFNMGGSGFWEKHYECKRLAQMEGFRDDFSGCVW